MSFLGDARFSFQVSRKDGKSKERYHFCMLLVVTLEPIVESALSVLDKFNQVPRVTIRDLIVYNDVRELPNETLKVPLYNRGKDPLGPHHYNVQHHALDQVEEVRKIFFEAVRSRIAQNFKKEDYIFQFNISKGPNIKISKNHRVELRNIATLPKLFGINAIEAPIRSAVCVDVILLGKWFLSIKTASRKRSGNFQFIRNSDYYSIH